MEIKKFTFNPFQENTFLLIGKDKSCYLVDPGMYFPNESEELFDYIEEHGLKLKAITNTHAHIDHVFGVAEVKRKFDVPFYLNSEDEFLLERAFSQAEMLGIPMNEKVPLSDIDLKEGQQLELDGEVIEVIEGPGHSPGHVAFYIPSEKALVNGDILFAGSYGRVDLPGGSIDELRATIVDKLFKLPEDTIVYCGHGPETSIGAEKGRNPILFS